MKSATDIFLLDAKPLNLAPEQLLQIGGEGAVYAHGAKAIKVYHTPDRWRADKLRYLVQQPVAQSFPPNVLSPQTLLLNGAGAVVGFAMARLPPAALPVRNLAQPVFCRQHAIGIGAAARLLTKMWDTLDTLHRRGIVVGDLNEGNIWFDRVALTAASGPAGTHWIDVDSYQVGNFPCPVALLPFLDPDLYHVRDFRSRRHFSPETDWYAFAVLLVRALLHVHPYGGTHHQLKSLTARAQAGISVFDDAVTYPQSARPPQVLPDPLLRYLRRIFEAGERGAFPRPLLVDLATSARHCPVCGLSYSASRPRCPRCRPRVEPVIRRRNPAWRVTRLLDGDATLLYVAPQSGAQIAIVRYRQGTYELGYLRLGQKPHLIPLFQGNPGYRFAVWGDLVVVNPPGSAKLLLVDVGEGLARRGRMLETCLFQGSAAFAVAGRFLYRLARGSLLRAEIRYGHVVEDMAATVYRDQATVWGAPAYDTVAGFQRSLAGSQFFLGGRSGAPLVFPAQPTPTGRSHGTITVCFSDKAAAFIWQSVSAGQTLTHYLTVTPGGKTIASMSFSATDSPHDWIEGKALVGTTLLHPVDDGILKIDAAGSSTLLPAGGLVNATSLLHPWRDGVLVQNERTLALLTTAAP